LTDQQQAARMQQQLLKLLSFQVKELQAAYPHVVDDLEASNNVYKLFTQEAEVLSAEVAQLSETMCVWSPCKTGFPACSGHLMQCILAT
jgi:hypothetical protein